MINFSYEGNNFSVSWNPMASGNCGITIITGIVMQQMGEKAKKANSYNLYVYDPPTKNLLSQEQLYEVLCKNIELISKNFQYSLVLISDNVARPNKASTVLDKTTPPKPQNNYFYGNPALVTRHFIKALRQTRCGMLVQSQVVNNLMHGNSSAIQGAFWTPPHLAENIIYNKPRWSNGCAKTKCTVTGGLKAGVDLFMKDVFNEPQDSKRAA